MDEANKLTERERQCLRLVHSHFNSKQIARELGIKPGTVDRHCENAARKLQADSRVAAAKRLVAAESGIPNDSQYEPLVMEKTGAFMPVGGAERTPYDPDYRYNTPRQLGRDGNHPAAYGDDPGQARHGPSPHGGDAQADALLDRWGRDVGSDLHRSRDVGRSLQSDLSGYAEFFGHGRLGSILLVFGLAAVLAWILTAIAGAEQFAMILQRFRHGG